MPSDRLSRHFHNHLSLLLPAYMLNEKDSKALDRISRWAYPILLFASPLTNLDVIEWLTPRLEASLRYLQSNYPLSYPFIIGFALIGMGWIAFQIKTRWRLAYGAAEVAIAYASGYAWFNSSPKLGLHETLAGAAVVYLAVRGFDNMREAKKAKKAKAAAKLIQLPTPAPIWRD